jgi:uncharacterized protein YxjI
MGKLTIEKDVLIPDRMIISDERSGREVGSIRMDVLIPGQYNVYDKNGLKEGTLKRDVLFRDRYRFEKK